MKVLRTLVLNAFGFPIRQEDWKRALIKTICDRAEILEFYDCIVRSPSQEFFVPAVIRLTRYNKIPKSRLAYSKGAVFIRDNFKCQYCRKQLTMNTTTIDHVIPRSRGGQTTFRNTVTSCNKCNSYKAHRLPEEAGMYLVKRPQIPKNTRYLPRLGMLEDEWKQYVKV
jgi:5-methylcytosine-specific restriction endonuclease McrA